MSLRKRGNRWFYRFSVDGVQYERSTGLAATRSNRNAAIQEGAEKMKEVLEGRKRSRHVPKSFSEARVRFLTWSKGEHKDKPATHHRIKTSFASLGEHFNKLKLVEINGGDVEAFKTWRRDEHEVREVTIRHDLVALNQFFRHCRKCGWMTFNPMEFVSMPSDKESVREELISDEEERRYFEIAKDSPNLHDVSKLVRLQGLRPGEAMHIQQDNVFLDRGRYGEILVVDGKSKAARRQLPLVAESQAILERRKQVSDRWIFPSSRKPGHPITKLNNPHNRVCLLADVSWDVYSLRHKFATLLARVAPIQVVARILGHNDLKTVMRYIHVQDEEVAQAMERYEESILDMRRFVDDAAMIQ